ncbi:MAG: type II toxin-antitoxin system death-on-curing family toxin [Nitrospirales bacterium]|nr:type II toxin-antitoxin system death-on-curing family toxin [Nitrospirales bacterium]
MRYLTIGEVLDLYHQVMQHTGGAVGVRDLNALASAIAQPGMTFDGAELYPTLIEKASALGFSLVMNHPFVDGNKRTGHAAMETFLVLNGFELNASVEEQEKIVLQLAAGELQREVFTDWLGAHLSEKI